MIIMFAHVQAHPHRFQNELELDVVFYFNSSYGITKNLCFINNSCITSFYY